MAGENYENLKAGDLLVAGAYLVDPNFSRSVILLCEHRDQGSFGLALNRVTDIRLNDLVPGIDWDAPVFEGGPVEENSLHVIHRSQGLDLKSEEVAPGIFWGGDFDRLIECINEGVLSVDDCRFFVGYSGWSPGQLREEVITDSWYLTDANPERVFDEDTTNHWRNVLKTMGPNYKLLSTFPDDPRLN